ncbi:MAG: retropepsin-like aspartic protease [Cyanobacteria bacterium P01_F01_bin.4]
MVRRSCNISAQVGSTGFNLAGFKKARVLMVSLLWVSSLLSACGLSEVVTPSPPESISAAKTADPVGTSAPVEPAVAEPSLQSASAYADGIQLASSAFVLGQSAQSPDDWQLVASRWQQAITTLKTVPQGDAHYVTAQAKLTEYQRNFNYAQQRLEQLKDPPPLRPIAAPVRPSVPALGQASGVDGAAGSAPVLADDRFRAPILRRQGGTPVIEVTFNGGQRYPMILDTGASHTLITRTMANELGVVTEGQINANTASNQSVVFDVGRVDSISVSGITQQNLPVGIGDSVEIGLLGNDFYKSFDLVLQEQSVEFRMR